MSTAYHNLSEYDPNLIPDASDMRFGIVVSEWNPAITESLLQGATDTLLKQGVSSENIRIQHVPGSFELTFGAHQLIEAGHVDAVIVLGCVIKGETPHFDYVCSSVTQGTTYLNATGSVPVIFGLITANSMEQAEARSGGNLGNKGVECAIAAIKMADLVGQIKKK